MNSGMPNMIDHFNAIAVSDDTKYNIAVIDGNGKYNYQKLYQDAHLLAAYLCSQVSLGEGRLISILCEKGYHQALSTLAILKADRAYLPHNINWPIDRNVEVCKQGNVKYLLISKKQNELISDIDLFRENEIRFLIIEDVLDEIQTNSKLKNQLLCYSLPSISPDSISYVIFTSGSSGKPKGVIISHQGAVNTIKAVNDRYGFTKNDSILAVSDLSFDLSVYDIFGPLSVGGTIVFPEQDGAKDPAHWLELVNKYNITFWNTVPQLCQLLIEEANFNKLKNLPIRIYLMSGDWIPVDLPRRIKDVSSESIVVSLGGATEGSIWSIWYEINEIKSDWASIPYGYAMPGQEMYVLNEQLENAKIGEAGEICIGGIGVALGYWGDSEKTSASFIKHKIFGRIYKTGDLGKWTDEGHIEFLGRKDNQVKINGYRVELGEIRSVLNEIGTIKDSLIQYQSDSKTLIAYYTMNSGDNSQKTESYMDKWICIYDEEYAKLDIRNFKENIEGWVSSFTNNPIPKNDMLEWVSNTVDRILEMSPKSILEIGSGSGLLLFNLIDHVDHYCATDFSSTVIGYTKKVAKLQNFKDKVQIIACAADSIPYDNLQRNYDTVICNSVAQYFPDVNYLENVISISIDNLKGSGKMFFGDIRDYRLLKCFHYAVQKYNNPNTTKEDIEHSISRDKELLVSPQFFWQVFKKHQRISGVQIMPKLGKADHEMNRYRYDVIFNVDGKYKVEICQSEIKMTDDIFREIDNFEDTTHSAFRYPIKRIYQEFLDCEKIVGNDVVENGLFPNEIASVSDILDYCKLKELKVQFFLDLNSENHLYVVFLSEDMDESDVMINYDLVVDKCTTKLSTNPLKTDADINNQSALAIKSHLSSKLPDYMIPAHFIKLESMPLTANGKIDVKRLPIPSIKDISHTVVVPRNNFEKEMCEIWANALGLKNDEIGIENDFFHFGGDSITGIRVIGQIRQQMGIHLFLKDIFSSRNIKNIFDNLSSERSNGNAPIIKREEGPLSGEVPLLPIQKWFFELPLESREHWNQFFMLKTKELDVKKLEHSLTELVKYHDGLRLRFIKTDKGIKQFYDPEIQAISLKTFNIKSLNVDEKSSVFEKEFDKCLSNWQNDFDFNNGPLFSYRYINGFNDGTARIFFAFHHLIIDSVSWRILRDDLIQIYEGTMLPSKSSSYRQWGHALEDYSRKIQTEKKYWDLVLNKFNQNIWSCFKESEKTRKYSQIIFPKTFTENFLKKAHKTMNTHANELLLVALSRAIYKATGYWQGDIVLEGHGREEIDRTIDIGRTVGWFTTMFPVHLQYENDIRKHLAGVKSNLKNIPEKGIGFGILNNLDPEKLPTLFFNYLGQFNTSDTENAEWTFVEDKIGEIVGISIGEQNSDYCDVNIEGMIVNEQLIIKSCAKIQQKVLDKLMLSIQESLIEIVDFLLIQKRTFLTSSDVNNIIEQSLLDELQKDKEIENIYRCNGIQEGLIKHHLNKEEKDDAYHVQVAWKYGVEIDSNVLRKAWNLAQKKYPALRLRFSWTDFLLQIIDKTGDFEWNYIDATCSENTKCNGFENIIMKDRLRSFDLEKGHLLRLYLIKNNQCDYDFILSFHHCILDGWSIPILLKFIHDAYQELLLKNDISTMSSSVYQTSQEFLQKDNLEAEKFWQMYIQNLNERKDIYPLVSFEDNLYGKRVGNYDSVIVPSCHVLELNSELYSGLRNICTTEGVTIHAILQFIWHRILNIYTNSEQTVVGTTVSGRTLPIDGIEDDIGLYINTLPLIVNHKFSADCSIIDSIKSIQNDINDINSFCSVKLSKIQAKGDRLFDTLVVHENYSDPIDKSSRDALKIIFNKDIEKLDYPLALVARESQSKILIEFKYEGNLFSEKRILALSSLFENIAE